MSTGLTQEMMPVMSAEARIIYRSALRKQLIERRLALSAADCAFFSASVCKHLQHSFPQLAALRVAFCWPVKNEPDLRPLIRFWLATGAAGFTALLPLINEPGAALGFRTWTPASRMIEDRYGIPTPAEGELLLPQALLIPVNAFDAAGYRVGYGGGFFDRTLAALNPAPLSIGVGFELSRVDSIHPEAHDVGLDAMVTEAGVFRNDGS